MTHASMQLPLTVDSLLSTARSTHLHSIIGILWHGPEHGSRYVVHVYKRWFSGEVPLVARLLTMIPSLVSLLACDLLVCVDGNDDDVIAQVAGYSRPSTTLLTPY